MITIDEIEKTSGGRMRKLLLTFGSVAGLLYVQFASGMPVSWPLSIGVALVVIAYTSSDVLEKFADSEMMAKLRAKLPGGK